MDAMPQCLIADDEDLIVNPERRLPCVIRADKSSSMTGAPIAQLNRAIQVLHSEISSRPTATRPAQDPALLREPHVQEDGEARASQAQGTPDFHQ